MLLKLTQHGYYVEINVLLINFIYTFKLNPVIKEI